MNKRSGFSLLEVLIAMTVLAIGVFGAVKLFPMALRQVQVAQERTITSEMADNMISQLRSVGARNLFYTWRMISSDPLWNVRQASNVYSSVSTEVSPVTDAINEAGQVFLQRATVSFKMPDGRYERFTTLIAEP